MRNCLKIEKAKLSTSLHFLSFKALKCKTAVRIKLVLVPQTKRFLTEKLPISVTVLRKTRLKKEGGIEYLFFEPREFLIGIFMLLKLCKGFCIASGWERITIKRNRFGKNQLMPRFLCQRF